MASSSALLLSFTAAFLLIRTRVNTHTRNTRRGACCVNNQVSRHAPAALTCWTQPMPSPDLDPDPRLCPSGAMARASHASCLTPRSTSAPMSGTARPSSTGSLAVAAPTATRAVPRRPCLLSGTSWRAPRPAALPCWQPIRWTWCAAPSACWSTHRLTTGSSTTSVDANPVSEHLRGPAALSVEAANIGLPHSTMTKHGGW